MDLYLWRMGIRMIKIIVTRDGSKAFSINCYERMNWTILILSTTSGTKESFPVGFGEELVKGSWLNLGITYFHPAGFLPSATWKEAGGPATILDHEVTLRMEGTTARRKVPGSLRTTARPHQQHTAYNWTSFLWQHNKSLLPKKTPFWVFCYL